MTTTIASTTLTIPGASNVRTYTPSTEHIALSSMCPWALAQQLGLRYSGDTCTIPHGGYWYSVATWESYGYADCVRVCESEGCLWVERGTISNPHDVTNILASCGWKLATDGSVVQEHSGEHVADELTPEMEIECTEGYWGMEIDSTDEYRERTASNFVGGFPELRIWKNSILPALQAMATE